jgi:hypothetical protein
LLTTEATVITPEPKFPVPAVAVITDPGTIPEVADIPVIVAVNGPAPDTVPIVPVVLIVPEVTDPNSRFLSSTVTVLELTLVKVPFTVKSPPTVKLPLVVVLPLREIVLVAPDEEPIAIAVVPAVDAVPILIVLLIVPAPEAILTVPLNVVAFARFNAPVVNPEPTVIEPVVIVDQSDAVAAIPEALMVSITGVVIVGDVARTTLDPAVPVLDINDVVVFAVPFPVEAKKDVCAAVLPARRARVPGVPVADA